MNGPVRRVALLGNHLPRQCGIATFTTDLAHALTAEFPRLDCFVLAMNDAGPRHAYPSRVRFEIGENDAQAYLRAADFLNVTLPCGKTIGFDGDTIHLYQGAAETSVALATGGIAPPKPANARVGVVRSTHRVECPHQRSPRRPSTARDRSTS